MARNQHVVPHGQRWAVRGDGNRRATRVLESQVQALDVARTIARNQGSDVVIHRRDGTLQGKDSYGRDPFPPRDVAH